MLPLMTQAPDIDDLIDAAVAVMPRRGGTALPPTLVREICPEDLARLRAGRRMGPPAMQRARTTHHLAAREVAKGQSDVQVSEIVGYTPMRIAQLRADPAFQELVAHYRITEGVGQEFVQRRLLAMGLALTEELMDRMERQPEKFSLEELRRWTETLLDRSGHGRQLKLDSRSLTVTVIDQIKREAGEQTEVRLLGQPSAPEGRAVSGAIAPPLLEAPDAEP